MRAEWGGLFKEVSYVRRWERLRKLHEDNHDAFRVLFLVEMLALVGKWAEPTQEQLVRLWNHVSEGGNLGVRPENLKHLLLPLWPLEIAKADAQLAKVAAAAESWRRFPYAAFRLHSAALLRAWWSIETIINDFAAIILEQRGAALSSEDRLMLLEKRLAVDGDGQVVEKGFFQPVLERLQSVFRCLTGRALDRQGPEWSRLVALKQARDGFVHRLGKGGTAAHSAFQDEVLQTGLAAVRSVVKSMIEETPEFAARFAYCFLAFWSCGNESPFFWDGSEGGSLYLGLASPGPEALPGPFAPERGNLL